VTGAVQGKASWLAADFFVLNLVLYSAVFIPLERLFALRADQPVFRRDWLVDLTYFFINSLLMEVLTILTLQPALILFDWARGGWVSGLVASLPVFVQVPAPSIIPPRRSTGSPARGSIWSTSSSRAD
jgi:lathosterol oxidase